MATLTKKLRAGLQLLAGVMPEATYTFREVVLGQQLLDEKMLTGADDKPIQPKQLYTRNGQRPLNHGRRLCQAYERSGRAGVLGYCQQYIEPEHFANFSAKLSELVPA